MNKRILLAAVLATLGVSGNALAATSVEDKIEVLMEEIEHLKLQMAQDQQNRAGGIQGVVDRTTVGGYGELHYNNFSGDVPTGETRTKDEIDFHRFVLFVGHRFNDWISLKSELEIEHSNTENHGAVELEQAYLDFNFNKQVNAKVGIFLIPLGMLNETHEPPTFFGVERNQIETRIIPSTWWEAGVGVYGEAMPGLNYQLNVTSSPDAGRFDAPEKGFREIRANVSEAPAEDFGVSGALNYTGVPGLLVGTAFFTGNTGQGNSAIGDARLTLWDVHARYQKGRLDLRALYAQGRLGDAGRVAAATSTDTPEKIAGWYAEAAYHVWKSGDQDFAPFIRYEAWDTHDEVPSGITRNRAYKNNVWTVGANYQPHPQVVLKADYQDYDKPDGDKGDKRLNMGMGYMF